MIDEFNKMMDEEDVNKFIDKSSCPINYPKIDINFKSFKDSLYKCLKFSRKISEDSFNEYYSTYKRHQYSLKLEWITKNGYESVSDWAYEFFQEFKIEETGIQLRPKKTNNGWILFEEDFHYTHPPVLKNVTICIEEQDWEFVIARMEDDLSWTLSYTAGELKINLGRIYWKDNLNLSIKEL